MKGEQIEDHFQNITVAFAYFESTEDEMYYNN